MLPFIGGRGFLGFFFVPYGMGVNSYEIMLLRVGVYIQRFCEKCMAQLERGPIDRAAAARQPGYPPSTTATAETFFLLESMG